MGEFKNAQWSRREPAAATHSADRCGRCDEFSADSILLHSHSFIKFLMCHSRSRRQLKG